MRIGDKRSGKGGRGTERKTIIFGLLQKAGNVTTHIVPDVKRKTLYPIVKENVDKGSVIHTDELRSYSILSEQGYIHETVNHSIGEYVQDLTHVNGLEGFWSQIKRSIRGIIFMYLVNILINM
ncbi:MAG: IS1595 family transposase [Rickettsiaceae bacterium]|nr:IS1595 family transposase [Rickettsiaceae bacterium]